MKKVLVIALFCLGASAQCSSFGLSMLRRLAFFEFLRKAGRPTIPLMIRKTTVSEPENYLKNMSAPVFPIPHHLSEKELRSLIAAIPAFAQFENVKQAAPQWFATRLNPFATNRTATPDQSDRLAQALRRIERQQEDLLGNLVTEALELDAQRKANEARERNAQELRQETKSLDTRLFLDPHIDAELARLNALINGSVRWEFPEKEHSEDYHG